MRAFLERFDVRVTIGYCVTASLWIISSDALLGLFLDGYPSQLIAANSVKGLGFVAVTTVVLFGILSAELQKRNAVEQALQQDIMRRKQVEEALRESEERYRSIFENAPLGVFRTTAAGKLVTVNPGCARIFGFESPEEMKTYVNQSNIGEVLYTDVAQREVIVSEAMAREGWHQYESRYRRKDGQIITANLLFRSFSLPQSDGTELEGFLEDITERKRAENALRESEERFRTLTTLAPVGVYLADAEGRVQYANEKCLEMGGATLDAALGENWVNSVHPDDRGAIFSTWKQIVKEGGQWGAEFRFQTPAGKTTWVWGRATPLRDSHGKTIGYIGTNTDITERKLAEEALRERDRLQAVLTKEQELNRVKNSIMRTISHEFRTPLAVITTSTELLTHYFERLNTEQRGERLTTIQTHVQHLNRMVDEIAAVVHDLFDKLVFQPAEIDLDLLCQLLIADLQATIGARHVLQFIGEHSLHSAWVDERLVNRILTNLLSNAIKYSPEGSEIWLKLNQEGSEVVIQVHDQGIGISTADQQRLFEPFFRASNAGSVGGNGLGLSIVRDCVTLHQGTISVESELTQGTTFTVRLPIMPRPNN